MNSKLHQLNAAESAAGSAHGQNAVIPRIWLVMGYRAGENSQILALGEAMGWPFEIKKIRHRRWEFVTSLCYGTSLSGIAQNKSSPLQPPWPDMVISAGLLNEPVCRWIRKQADRPVRVVHIGRPWADPGRFDLVVTTPQYRLPEHPNVLQNTLPLHRVTRERLTAAGSQWAPRLAHLPRPWIAVILGGNSGPYSLGSKAGQRLGRQASAMAKKLGGSLLVTASSRTSSASLAALESVLEVPSYIYPWTPDGSENPYFGYLGLADALVVTGDSMAMLAEACATCKPVYIFDLGDGADAMRHLSQPGRGKLKAIPLRRNGMDFNLGGFLYWQLMRTGSTRLSRDLGLIHQRLLDSGRAVWLGEDFTAASAVSPPHDIERAVARVRLLL